MKNATKILKSWARVMVVAILVKFMDLGADLFSMNLESLKHLVQAGVVAVIPVILRYLDPTDAAFGVIKKTKQP